MAGAILLLCGLASGTVGAEAAGVTVRGIPEQGFGRIELTFDRPTKVRARMNGSVLVIAFGEPVAMRAEKLPAELSAYVAVSRRDPDGTGLRLALTRAYRISQLEAGERIFVDLLPERWTGLPPGLPPEVVAALAERARAAEERLRDGTGPARLAVRPVLLRLAETSDQTRFVFEPPAGTVMRFEEKGSSTLIRFEGPLTLDVAGNRPKSADGVADFSWSRSDDALSVRIDAQSGRLLRGFLDEGTAIVELLKPTPPASSSTPPPAASAEPPKPSRAQAAPPPSGPVTAEAPPPRQASALPADPVIPPIPDSAATAGPQRTIRPQFVAGEKTPTLVFPFQRPMPAAAFERGGRTILVFQTQDRIEIDDLSPEARAAFGLQRASHQGQFATLVFEARAEQPLRLLPQENGWRLAAGGTASPADDVLVTRADGPEGRGDVSIALAGSGVHWLLDPDDVPLAVVTTMARQGLANPRRFVEFQLLPTIQGAVVQPNADEVRVALARGGVLVSRKSGLALSAVGQPGAPSERQGLVIRGDEWDNDASGDVLAIYRSHLNAATEASRPDRAAIRFNLARFLIANGLSHEAGGVLAVASADDPVFARRRETLLLSGIAAALADRTKPARGFLSDETLGSDPEATLWRAVLDAREHDWPRAVAGFRRAETVLSRYPDRLAGRLRLISAQAAIAAGDAKAAEENVQTIERLPLGAVPRDEIDLAHAAVGELVGRTTAALATYERLAEAEARPVAAQAALKLVQLGRRTARMPTNEAISRLEALSAAWRGDDVELATLAELVQLYAETKRWREMLTTARSAQLRFQNRDEARRAQDTATAAFASLLLGRDGEDMDPVAFLALYYDFKEFAPIGRRGDEIVRRIADRLVSLDLLDQAATLLQYQVDNRLAGVAKATIAARLAALRLMGGKPAVAISTLQASRMADLPVALRRLRTIIEAQAQADLHRVDLALETVEGEDGADFARLRASIHFGARRWREAGEAFESLAGTRWQEPGSLSDEDRADVIRAVLADTLAGETMALDRIRGKFQAKMADSPDAKLFEALLRPRAVQSTEFRTALREASRVDNLRRFLGDWARISELPPESEPAPGKAARTDTRTGRG